MPGARRLFVVERAGERGSARSAHRHESREGEDRDLHFLIPEQTVVDDFDHSATPVPLIRGERSRLTIARCGLVPK